MNYLKHYFSYKIKSFTNRDVIKHKYHLWLTIKKSLPIRYTIPYEKNARLWKNHIINKFRSLRERDVAHKIFFKNCIECPNQIKGKDEKLLNDHGCVRVNNETSFNIVLV
jgi:hypothetical protein